MGKKKGARRPPGVRFPLNRVGVEGFEPTNGGSKTRCLTTWLHSNIENGIVLRAQYSIFPGLLNIDDIGLLSVDVHCVDSVFAFPARHDLATYCLEGNCSIQLNYGNIIIF